jgi:hypothetical protein
MLAPESSELRGLSRGEKLRGRNLPRVRRAHTSRPRVPAGLQAMVGFHTVRIAPRWKCCCNPTLVSAPGTVKFGAARVAFIPSTANCLVAATALYVGIPALLLTLSR